MWLDWTYNSHYELRFLLLCKNNFVKNKGFNEAATGCPRLSREFPNWCILKPQIMDEVVQVVADCHLWTEELLTSSRFNLRSHSPYTVSGWVSACDPVWVFSMIVVHVPWPDLTTPFSAWLFRFSKRLSEVARHELVSHTPVSILGMDDDTKLFDRPLVRVHPCVAVDRLGHGHRTHTIENTPYCRAW